MNQLEYEKLQSGGPIIKPIHYHIGEWEAIQYFCSDLPKNSRILDVGCGIGYGVGMFNKLGFHDVLGIDINSIKIDLGKMLGYNVIKTDILEFKHSDFYDVIWASHSFEHMLYPDKVLNYLLKISSIHATFFFILPYPDINPAPAHCASKILKTNINDVAISTIKWFEERGLNPIQKMFSTFREPEVWLEFVKK